MTPILDADADGRGRRVAVAVADFNAEVTGALLQGCLETLAARGVDPEQTVVARVPGAFELPAACDRLAASGRFDAVVALGAVVRGETPHFDYVAGECARGIMEVNLRRGVPVAFGVLTTDTLEQARARAAAGAGSSAAAKEGPSGPGRAASNKGAEAAEAALRMAALFART